MVLCSAVVVLSPRSQQDANHWIFHRVPCRLRQVNEEAYVPRVISIGPYHYGKEHLKAMEDVKRSYFRLFSRMDEDILVDAMMKEVEAIRKYYEGPLDHIDPKTFAKMLVFDGCFILQLLEKGFDSQIEEIHQVNIRYDLLLLENQLPFFVLLKLYSMMRNDGQQEIKEKLHRLACCFFDGWVLGQNIHPDFRYPDYHLLGLVYDSWLLSHSKIEFALYSAPISTAPEVVGSRKFISCATDLARAGIKFRKKCEWNPAFSDISEQNTRLLDIHFARDAKELKIPRLRVDDNTEVILRNMMAYEQFIISKGRPTLVCDYVTFMDYLIDSGEDVQILRDAYVIDNWLGDVKAVAKMFNKLRDFTYVSKRFPYEEISDDLKEHCRKRRYKWLAALKRDYFNTPWSSISFFAAFFLLALTVAQTMFSYLSYVKQ